MDELNQMQNPNITSPSMSPGSGNSKKLWFWIVIAVAVVVAGLVWYFSTTQVGLDSQLPSPTPTPEVEAQLDSQINVEEEGVDLGDLDAESKGIDHDLNSL